MNRKLKWYSFRRRTVVAIIVVLSCTIAVFGCRMYSAKYSGGFEMDGSFDKIIEQMEPLDKVDAGGYPNSVTDYFEYYGLDPGGGDVEHIFGSFESGDYTLVGHIFKPRQYKAVVVVLHGYFNHCGQLNHLIEYLVDNGYAVAAFDLPGHGLSSGDRASIEDFSEYSSILQDFVKTIRPGLSGPYHVIGHSTGGAAIIDSLLAAKSEDFEKVILVAPLVRSAAWISSGIGTDLYDSFAESIPRVFRRNSSDKDFLDFVKHSDPLQQRQVPVKWFNALYKWNDEIEKHSPCEHSLLLIQGNRDDTVAWQHNIEFIQAKFGEVQLEMIEGGMHELLNESVDMRNKVFSQIKAYLEGEIRS